MRISDWSSDVCSSDLRDPDAVEATARYTAALERAVHPKEGKGRKRPKQERENHAETQHLDAPISCCACSFMEWARSEEHTSELQSLMRISYAVFCVKKKNHTMTDTSNRRQQHNLKT